MNKENIIVAHSDIQHSPRLAYAIQKNNRLKKFYVGYYYKPESFFWRFINLMSFRKIIQEILTKRKFGGVDFIQSKLSTFPLLSFPIILLQRLMLGLNRGDLSVKLSLRHHLFFDWLISNFYLNSSSHVFVSYLNISLRCFEKVKRNNGICILDYSTIHIKSIEKLLEEEQKLSPEFISQLKLGSTPKSCRIEKELDLADYIIVPSSFSKKTLVENGVAEKKIEVIPYGTNIDAILPNEFMEYVEGNVLEIIFVGQIQQKKGIRYLLEAIRQLKVENVPVRLRLIGRIYGCKDVIESYGCSEYLSFLNKQELRSVMKDSHVLVLPTLYDSFGLVTLESMSCGVLPILSENVGSKDLIDESCGFEVPIRDVNSIIEKLKYLVSNPDVLNKMRTNAIEKSKHYTWSRYYSHVNQFVDQI